MVVKRAIAFGVILIAIFFISAFIFSQPMSAEATLQVTNGEVVVQQPVLFGQTKAVVVSGGETLTVSSSDTVEVPADAAAILYLFEGSTVELSANTVLELTELADNSGGHQIYMTLLNGRILNRVTKLLGVDDAYEVRTPSSTASVRGTIFSVEVIDQLSSQIVVTEGIVEVRLGSELAQVQAGEMVTAVTGQPLNVEPINNPALLAPAAPPTQIPTENTSGQSSEPRISPEEATATDAANPLATTTDSPTGTTTSPGSPTGATQPPGLSATASPPANATTGPAVPTNTVVTSQPPGSSTTPLPPTSTPRPGVPTSTSAPVVPTNTPVPIIPTNTPVPVIPTNTPVPVIPTNTPVPVIPTNTPVPPTPTEPPSQVTLCHNPGPNQQTIQVDAGSVDAHLNHGDYLGACN